MHLILRKTILLFLLAVSFSYSMGIETSNKDEKVRILSDAEVQKQLEIANSFYLINSHATDSVLNELLKNKIRNKVLYKKIIDLKCDALANLSHPEESITFLNQIISTGDNDPKYFYYLARSYVNLFEYSKAISNLQEAIIIYNTKGDLRGVADMVNYLTEIYAQIEMFEQAGKYFTENIELCKRINYKEGLLRAYKEYGENLSFENPQLALELLLKAKEIAESDEKQGFRSVAIYLIRFYIKTNQLQIAKTYVNKYFNQVKETDYIHSSNIYTLMAHIYSLELNIDSTIYFNKKALEKRALGGNVTLMASSYLNLAGNYLAIDKIQKANEYLEKAKEAVFKSNDTRMIMVYYQGKVKYFEYIKDYKTAYLFAQEELRLSRELADERHKSVLAKLNSSYKIQQKNILLEKELEERKAAVRSVIFILITVFLLAVGAYLIYLYKKKNFSYLRLEKKTSSIEKKLSISDKERKKFQSVFEYSVTGILILDKHGIIQYGNRKSKELLGQKNSDDQLWHISFAELFTDEHKIRVQDSISQAFVKPQKNDGFKVQTFSGDSFHWLDISFAPLYFSQEEHSILVSLIDVTQEVINIEKEQEQKRELQTLINSVTESILFIQVDGRIKALNLTAANRLTTEIEHLIGSNYFDFVPQLLLERRRAMFNKVVLTKMPLIETEMEANYNYLVSMYPNINASGEVDYISEFVQDITEKRIAEEEIDKLKQRVFRSQMNPHFIFNSLTSIQSFILSNNVDSASKYLNSFARLIRLILESSRLDYISLKNEIDILTYYLDIQKMRFADNFDYKFSIDPEIELERVKVPPMLAQPFIENAIEHGIQHLDIMGKIKLKVVQEGKFIFFELIDNGIGRAAAQSLNKDNVFVPNSLATQIINDRIKAINKYAKEEISYEIIDLKDKGGKARGTHVIIKIPLTRF